MSEQIEGRNAVLEALVLVHWSAPFLDVGKCGIYFMVDH